MARATTENFDQMVLEVETSTPGTYAKICGMVGVTITRTANLEESEIPDCDDETAPHAVDAEVRSLTVTVSGTGVWAQSSQDMLKTWFYSGAAKNVRLTDAAAAIGDAEVEAGQALLTTLTNTRAKGQKVTAEIELRFKGLPSMTDKAA